MKIAFKIILLVGVVGYLVFAITTMSRNDGKRICQGTKICIEDTTADNFADSGFVASLLSASRVQIKGLPIRDIDINGIDSIIKGCPYVDSVVCYYTPEDIMCIKVIPRKPILHVMADNGECYYMDSQGNTMPSDRFPLDLCLVTGNVTKQFAKEHLLDVARFISTHDPWDKDIQQIHVKSPKHVELIPSVEGQTIVIGEPIGIEDKMKRLSAFYDECLNKAGWNKYSIINLNYADQVVCTKKHH